MRQKMCRSSIAVLLLFSGLAWGQDPAPPAAEEIAALREEIMRLTNQLNHLEARYAASQSRQEEQAKAAEEAQSKTPKVTLDGGGLRVSSEDGSFEHRVRLRLAHDFAWFRQQEELKRALGDEQDGTDFRFARIQLQGRFWKDFTYVGEFDFAGQDGADSPKFRDVYLQYNAIPFFCGESLHLRIGHFREPFSLDDLNPIPYRQFLEKALVDVFVPSRNAGIQLGGAHLGTPKEERLTWALGVFKETDDIPSNNDSDEDQGWQMTGRVTGLPYYANGGRRLLHLGAAYSRRNPDGARLRYGLRPESRVAILRYADTDNLPVGFRLRDARADNVNLFGLESAGVFGPFSFQCEYIHSNVETTFSGTLDFWGGYLQTAYLLTGEHRPYRNQSGVFEGVKPRRPFKWRGENRGWGAWELAARYGMVDLNDGPVRGGRHASLTLGLNWYANQNVRLSTNYIFNDVSHDLYDGRFDVLQTRFQMEF